MSDWSTVAPLATALGTLVLALATFVAVRAANRAARVAEYSMQIGIRPLLTGRPCLGQRAEDHVGRRRHGGRTSRCPERSEIPRRTSDELTFL
jgi:hypothetical protein